MNLETDMSINEVTAALARELGGITPACLRMLLRTYHMDTEENFVPVLAAHELSWQASINGSTANQVATTAALHRAVQELVESLPEEVYKVMAAAAQLLNTYATTSTLGLED